MTWGAEQRAQEGTAGRPGGRLKKVAQQPPRPQCIISMKRYFVYMATTVRVRDEDKALLDSLQARFTLGTGSRIALDEVLHRVLAFADEHQDEIIMTDAGPALPPGQVKAFFHGSSRWENETRDDDVDRVLYGSDEAP